MLDAITAALHVLLSTAGLALAPESAAVGLAVAVFSMLLAVALAAAVAAPSSARRDRAHPRRAIDLSSPLSQSDPDASGHPRPRAPGWAAPAA